MAQSRSLRERVAGQSAMSRVVFAQQAAPPQTAAARIFGLSPLTAESRLSYRGALGELLVGDVLENLGQRWDVLHDVPLGDTLLDHLVIGPAGVFTVHTVNYTDQDVTIDGATLLVAGEAREDIQAARTEADAAAQLLSAAADEPVRVRPLLVVVEPRRLSVKSPASVRVIPSFHLERVLTKAPRTMSGDEVASISDLADLASTWSSPDAPQPDTQKLHRDFSLVRAAVRSALMRRILWTALGIATIYATVIGLIAYFVSIVVLR